MASLRRILCLCLLLWWIPATTHCALTSAFPESVKISCPYDKDDGSPSDPDCPSCSTLCKGLHLGYEMQIDLQAPEMCDLESLFIDLFILMPDVEYTSPLEMGKHPPQAICIPTFVLNTALPVRGPSFLA